MNHWIDEVLAERRGAVAVTLVTNTIPDMVKKHRETKEPNPYFGRLRRICRRPGMLGAKYENAVSRQRVAEADPNSEVEAFHAEALWGGAGEHDGRFTVRHKTRGTRYLVLFPKRDDEGTPIVLQDLWLCDGIEIPMATVDPYLSAKERARNQEVERTIPWRTIELDNVVELVIGGVVHQAR